MQIAGQGEIERIEKSLHQALILNAEQVRAQSLPPCPSGKHLRLAEIDQRTFAAAGIVNGWRHLSRLKHSADCNSRVGHKLAQLRRDRNLAPPVAACVIDSAERNRMAGHLFQAECL